MAPSRPKWFTAHDFRPSGTVSDNRLNLTFGAQRLKPEATREESTPFHTCVFFWVTLTLHLPPPLLIRRAICCSVGTSELL